MFHDSWNQVVIEGFLMSNKKIHMLIQTILHDLSQPEIPEWNLTAYNMPKASRINFW